MAGAYNIFGFGNLAKKAFKLSNFLVSINMLKAGNANFIIKGEYFGKSIKRT